MFMLSGSVTLTVMADTLALLNRVASASRSGAEATFADHHDAVGHEVNERLCHVGEVVA
jgi:hypothetical protein